MEWRRNSIRTPCISLRNFLSSQAKKFPGIFELNNEKSWQLAHRPVPILGSVGIIYLVMAALASLGDKSILHPGQHHLRRVLSPENICFVLVFFKGQVFDPFHPGCCKEKLVKWHEFLIHRTSATTWVQPASLYTLYISALLYTSYFKLFFIL